MTMAPDLIMCTLLFYFTQTHLPQTHLTAQTLSWFEPQPLCFLAPPQSICCITCSSTVNYPQSGSCGRSWESSAVRNWENTAVDGSDRKLILSQLGSRHRPSHHPYILVTCTFIVKTNTWSLYTLFPVEVLLDDAQSAAIIANAFLLATLTGIIPLNPNVSWVEGVS